MRLESGKINLVRLPLLPMFGALVLMLVCAPLRAQTTQPGPYPDTADGLTQYIKDMLLAADANNQPKLLAMSQALVLPNPRQWFKDVFGPEKAPKLADEYETNFKNFGPSLAVLFLNLETPKELKVRVTKVESLDDPNVKLPQTYVLEAMQKPYALYSVELTRDGTNANLGLWSLVYVDGYFRVAGKMQSMRDLVKKQNQPQR